MGYLFEWELMSNQRPITTQQCQWRLRWQSLTGEHQAQGHRWLVSLGPSSVGRVPVQVLDPPQQEVLR